MKFRFKKIITHLLPFFSWFIIPIFIFYVFIGIIITAIGSYLIPRNKAINLLHGINLGDLFNSGKFLFATTFIVIGSLAIIVKWANFHLKNNKYLTKIVTFTKFTCQIWLIVAFSLFLLNSFKEDIYNLITVIIATATVMWHLCTKITHYFFQYIDEPKQKGRKAPKYPPKRLHHR